MSSSLQQLIDQIPPEWDKGIRLIKTTSTGWIVGHVRSKWRTAFANLLDAAGWAFHGDDRGYFAMRPIRENPTGEGLPLIQNFSGLSELPHPTKPRSPQVAEIVAQVPSAQRDEVLRGETLVMGFMGRPLEKAEQRPDMRSRLPATVYLIGEPAYTTYHSTRDDPSTRDARQKDPAADPTGGAGHDKQFIHHHSTGHGLGLYSGKGDGPAQQIDWPDTLAYMGELDTIKLVEGRTIRKKKGAYELWAFPDARTVVALPARSRLAKMRGPITDLFVWYGGHARVSWRGWID